MTTSCRFELFVTDIDESIRFYTAVLDFGLQRRDDGYASLVRDRARIGLGLISMVPEFGTGPGFTQERVSACRGAGVEIVIEVRDIE